MTYEFVMNLFFFFLRCVFLQLANCEVPVPFFVGFLEQQFMTEKKRKYS